MNKQAKNIESRGAARGSWGAREFPLPPPFCKPFLSKQPTTGGENDMTIL